MPSSFEISVRLNIDRHHLWRVRASKTFMAFLVSEGALNRMDATPIKPHASSPTASTRRQFYVPTDMAIPDLIKPLVDDAFVEISDIQVWDDTEPFVQHSIIKPGVLSDVISTAATLTMEEDPASSTDDIMSPACLHTLAGHVSVSIPFLGYYVEQAVITNMHAFYETYSTHIDNFVDMVIDKFGDGTPSSLPLAIDALLDHEKASLLKLHGQSY